MSLDTLPEEVLLLIIKYLDTKSIKNLFDAGNGHIRTSLTADGVLRTCDFSLSTLSTVGSLETEFFMSLSKNIQKLDLKGIQDLQNDKLLSAVKNMKKLTTLDISYTRITMSDFIELHGACPSIKNIAIDYIITGDLEKRFSLDDIKKWQEVFAKLENIHFVGSAEDLLYSSLPRKLLEKTELNSLTFTFAKESMSTLYKYEFQDCDFITCKNLNIFNLYWRGLGTDVEMAGPKHQGIVKDLYTYEYIHLRPEQTTKEIECSAVFKEFFEEKFHSTTIIKKSFNHHYNGVNTVCMFWNRELTKFDNDFYKKLFRAIKPLFPCYKRTSVDYRPITSDWIWVRHSECFDKCNFGLTQPPKNKSPPAILNYDLLLKNVQRVEMSLYFLDELLVPVKLMEEVNFLAKLTFLELNGTVNYDDNFFEILFKNSVNLTTFNFEAALQLQHPCMHQISQALKYSKSLKNVRVGDRKICFKTLMSGLSECHTLSNIVIVDATRDFVDIGDPTELIKNCEDLYYLCVDANIDDRQGKMELYHGAKNNFKRDHLFIELIPDPADCRYSYDPFIDVYKLDRIKVVPVGFN